MDDWEDWETESAFPSLDNAPKTWDDEEEESSDDEDIKPKPSAPVNPEKQAKKKVKPISKKKKKVEQKKPSEPEEPLDPIAEKKRREQLQIDADYENILDMVGDAAPAEEAFFATGEGPIDADDDGKKSLGERIDETKPRSEKEFYLLAALLSQKMKPYETSRYYSRFMKELLQGTVDGMSPEELKELAGVLTSKANEKIQSEKKGKKKKGGKKLNVDFNNDLVEDEFDFLA